MAILSKWRPSTMFLKSLNFTGRQGSEVTCHRIKFHDNRSNRCQDNIAIVRFSKMTDVRYFGFGVRVFGTPTESTSCSLSFVVQNFVGIGNVVLKIRVFQCYASLA